MPAEEKPQLLAAETYRDRFEAHQLGTSRAALILLAIAAFWLAIEGGYTRFRDGRASNDALQTAEKARDESGRLLAYEKIRSQAGPAKPTAPEPAAGPAAEAKSGPAADKPAEPPPAPPPVATNLGTGAEEDLAKKAKRVEKLEKDIEELRKASVTLSIAGTNLPPQLTLAPIVWLGALLVWLIYFEWRREQAHRNLLLYDQAVSAADRKQGSAGEGILWLAPLPGSRGPGGEDGENSSLLALVGWDRGTEKSYRVSLATIFILVALVAARVAWIGLDLSSSSASGMKLADPYWRFASVVLVAGAFILCMVHVSRVIQARTDVGPTDARSLLSRRQLIVGAGAVGVAGLMFAFVETRLSLSQLGRRKPRLAGGSSRSPRFVAQSRRTSRLERYRTSHKVPPPQQRERLYWSSRPSRGTRRSVTIWAADSSARIRLYSVAGYVRHMAELSGDALRKAVGQRAPDRAPARELGQLPLNPNRTNAFELAAIRHLEEAARRTDPEQRDSPIVQACNILLDGVRVNFVGRARRPNLRLMDLLAGLAVRYNKRRHLDALIRVLDDRRYDRIRAGWLTRTKAGPVDPINIRIRKWRSTDSRWARDWRMPDKVWKYTAETEPNLLDQGSRVIADPAALKPKHVTLPPAAPDSAARPDD